jgi:trimeric autotransporter adhesin
MQTVDFSNDGNSHYGNYYAATGNRSGITWGSYNLFSGAKSGNIAGSETLISDTGGSFHYGQINSLIGSGSGNKYGSYNYIDFSAGGFQYGVYSSATLPSSYAGYFLGNVFVSGVFTNPSDESLKENIAPTQTILGKINALQVKDYSFKSDLSQKYGFARGQQTGFIAQEMEQLFPNLVKEETLSTPKDPAKIAETTHEERTIKSINYVGLIPYLTKAIQEQQEIIESEKEKSARLEAELNAIKQNQLQLEARLQKLESK